MKPIIVCILYLAFYSRGLKILLSVAFCFLFCTFHAYSEKADYLPVGLDIRIPDQGYEEINKLREVLESAAVVELEREGFEVAVLPSGSSEASEPDVSAILVLDVTVEEPELQIEMAFHIPSLPEAEVRTGIESHLDLALDAVIAEALKELIGQVRSLIPVQTAEPEVAEPEVAEPEVAEPEVAEPEVAEPEVAEPEVAEPEVAEPEVVEPEVAEPEVAEPPRLFRLSAGAGPFVAVGKLNYYFNIGIMAAIQGGFRIQTDAGDFEPGIMAGVIYFDALGLETTCKTHIMPVGAGLRWAATGETLSIYLTLAGGAAFLNMYVSETEQYMKTDGFVSAGAGARLIFGDFWGLTAEVVYLMVFEDFYPIMGIAPSLYFDILF